MASSHYKKSNAIHNHSSNKTEEAVQRFASLMIERMTALKNESWEKGWFNGHAYEGLPQNYSGRTYNASNSFMLQMISSMEGYSMPVFMTFKQAMDNGLRINKGAESFPVVYWDVNIKDTDGKRIDFDDYKKLTKEERANYQVIPFLKYYPVFNIDQTNFKEVKPEKYEALRAKFNIPDIKDAEGMYSHNALDNVVSKQTWLCPVNADKLSDDAYYSPSRDVVVIPMKAQFKKHQSEEEIFKDGMQYYSTMLHEMAHSTGHKDRLDRVGGKFGDPKYAKEELVAELTAAMIGNSMGFDSKITDNSAKYLDNWLGALKEDPKFIVSVMADVNKAADMILDKVDEQRLALGETPYLSKNMVSIDNGYSLEPEFKPVPEALASEPWETAYGISAPIIEMKLHSELWNKDFKYQITENEIIKINESLLGTPHEWDAKHTIFSKENDNAIDNLNTNNISDQEKRELYPKLKGAKLLEKRIEPLYDEDPYGRLVKRGTIDVQKWDLSDIFPKQELKLRVNDSLVMEAEEIKEEKSSLMKQYDEMKKKHPDAILLFRVGDFYETFNEDAIKSSEILGITMTRRATCGNSIELAGFPHQALDTYLPKLVGAGQRVAICEQLIDPKKEKKLAKRGIIENNDLKKDNGMAKVKKFDESVSEKKEKKTKVSKEPTNKEETKVENKEFNPEVKSENLKETKTEENKKEPVTQSQKPQMITVNGDEIRKAHIFQSNRDKDVWYFIAELGGKKLKPVRIDHSDINKFFKKEATTEAMMQKYYPTKLMKRVPDAAFLSPNVISTEKGLLKIEKFNVYKETNAESQDFGKYKFFANVDGKNMSVVARQEDLNAYFDRVQNPSQMVEKIFGNQLDLPDYYKKFNLPEKFNQNIIKIEKNRQTNHYDIYLDFGKRGKSVSKELEYHDRAAYFEQKATRAQLGAKYLGNEITEFVKGTLTVKTKTSSLSL